MNPSELFRAGKLAEAVTAAQDWAKSKPMDLENRMLMSQLWLFVGDLERADKQAEFVAQQSPEFAVGIALLRQLIRGEMARRQFFVEGLSPRFLAPDDSQLQMRVAAAVALREGDPAEAERLLAQAEQERAPASGHGDGQPFADMRDLDDLFGPVLEAVTANGRYYWINLSTVRSLEFHEPTSYYDYHWRRATVSIVNGPDGDVYLPVLYPMSHEHHSDAVRLGRETIWSETSPVRGMGQRMYLMGEEAISILEMRQFGIQQVDAATG